jgi:hypothetical protein
LVLLLPLTYVGLSGDPIFKSARNVAENLERLVIKTPWELTFLKG